MKIFPHPAEKLGICMANIYIATEFFIFFFFLVFYIYIFANDNKEKKRPNYFSFHMRLIP